MTFLEFADRHIYFCGFVVFWMAFAVSNFGPKVVNRHSKQ